MRGGQGRDRRSGPAGVADDDRQPGPVEHREVAAEQLLGHRGDLRQPAAGEHDAVEPLVHRRRTLDLLAVR